MAGEQMLILRMVEEGKITADQAVGLLEALGGGSADATFASNTATQPEQRSLVRVVREEERKVRQAVREEAAQAREVAREARAQARHIRGESQRLSPEKTIMASLRALGIPLGGNKEFSFTRTVSGRFSASNPCLRVQNTNGRIEIRPSDDDSWQIRLLTRVRADDEASAQALAAKLVHIESDEQLLAVQAQRMFGQNASVTMELLVPARNFDEMSVAATNGTIQLAELAAAKMALKTVNGKVIGEKLQASDLQASSVNGAVTIDGAIERMHGRAANGRITVAISPAMSTELDLKTVNGSISVALPEAAEIGYQLDVASTSGSIKYELPNLVVSEEQKKPGRRTLVAVSTDFAAKQLQQKVRARTVSGAVRINV